MKDILELSAGIGIILTIMLVFFWVYRGISVADLRQQAIHQGFAEYNATNGVWQWKSPANLERAK